LKKNAHASISTGNVTKEHKSIFLKIIWKMIYSSSLHACFIMRFYNVLSGRSKIQARLLHALETPLLEKPDYRRYYHKKKWIAAIGRDPLVIGIAVVGVSSPDSNHREIGNGTIRFKNSPRRSFRRRPRFR